MLRVTVRGTTIMEKLIVEVRAAEGGHDAKLLVGDQFSIYQKLAERESL